MKRFIVSLFCLALTGCVAVSYPVEKKASLVHSQKTILLTGMDKISHGMTFTRVQELIGESQTVGYEKCEECAQGFKEIAVKNPYRQENYSKNSKEYRIYYYYTSLQKPDGLITDDELTPFIFEDDILIGKGFDFLFRLKN